MQAPRISNETVFSIIVEVQLRFRCKCSPTIEKRKADRKRKEGVFIGWTVKMFFLSCSDWAGVFPAGQDAAEKMDAL